MVFVGDKRAYEENCASASKDPGDPVEHGELRIREIKHREVDLENERDEEKRAGNDKWAFVIFHSSSMRYFGRAAST